METENDIIKRAIGNPDDFGLIIDAYSNKIYNFVFSALRDEERSKDLTQEVFIKVWKNLHKFNLEKNFSVWIYTIAKNTLIDFYRKKKDILFGSLNKDIDDDFGDNIPDTLPLPDEIFEKNEIKNTVNNALENLSPEDRMIISLHNNEELTFEDVSNVLNMPLNTVKSRYRRSLIKLRNILINAPK